LNAESHIWIKNIEKLFFVLSIQRIEHCFCKFRAIFFALQNAAFDIGRITEFNM